VPTRVVRPTSNGWVGAPPRIGGQQGGRGPQPGGQPCVTAGVVGVVQDAGAVDDGAWIRPQASTAASALSQWPSRRSTGRRNFSTCSADRPAACLPGCSAEYVFGSRGPTTPATVPGKHTGPDHPGPAANPLALDPRPSFCDIEQPPRRT
jgi:hypothetical protein